MSANAARTQIRKVLFVEDDSVLLRALTRSAQLVWDATSSVATSLAEAKRCAALEMPDLVIVDMNLPDGCGIDLIQELRVHDSHACLVLASGYLSVDSTVRAMRAGADDVLSKPFTLTELAKRLGCGTTTGVTAEPKQWAPSIHLAGWEHVQRVYLECCQNKSEAARQLGIDRNTLKRWLAMARPRS